MLPALSPTQTVSRSDGKRSASPDSLIQWHRYRASPPYSIADPNLDTGFDLYQVALPNGTPVPLVIAPDQQFTPTLVGNQVLWQTEEGGQMQLRQAAQTELIAVAHQQQIQARAAASHQRHVSANSIIHAQYHTTLHWTRPVYKGIHEALGGGGATATDALGAPNEPFFGSAVVLSTDLGASSGRPSPWGPSVADALKNMQQNYSGRIIVRTYNTLYPNASGSTGPGNISDQVINLASTYDWIHHVQINNEPNLEWPSNCNGCFWVTNGVTKSYTWSSRDDYRLFQAINDFYTDASYVIDYYKANYSNLTIRNRLQQMEIWSPPLSERYGTLPTGENPYAALHTMLTKYARLAYHPYPAPNYDAEATYHGLINNAYVKGFDAWTKTNVDNGTLRSIITEFGWNPGQMTNCGYNQDSTWPGAVGSTCRSNDGYSHKFADDTNKFLLYQRHGAEVVAAWILGGYNDQENGILSNGTVTTWLHYYQWSRP